ncbi:MAG: acetolactate synthase small subunit, partial [Alcanivorax sp.]|nr:acetolactate synthase small subunit [Alcanivorax sp.]
MRRIISILMENEPGALSRVVGLFSQRGYNIETLTVAPTEDEKFSRITFTVDIEGTPLDQVVKQLDKLINVVDIRELDPATAVERELMLVIVDTGDGERDKPPSRHHDPEPSQARALSLLPKYAVG